MKTDEYHRDGYTSLEINIAADDVQLAREKLQEWVGENPETNHYGILRNNAYQHVPFLNTLLKKYKLGKLACQILDRPEIILFQDNLIWKPSGTTQRVEWHQDYSYWPLSAPVGITFWIALDDCTEENGCMRFIPRSHCWGECRSTNFVSPDELSEQSTLPILPWRKYQSEAISIALKAGQGVAHHPLLAHMSLPNLSAHHRRGWSISWIDPLVLWDPDHAPHPYPIFHNIQKGDTVEGDDFPRFTR